ncbi:uncharacterized protein NEMAJ01_0976 [Nematocida major]|uniref:uncharacterized protein n=1 Tax=Nematocida major TaxID=1912982 RepID=UPI002007BA70|nr:uncharacterized protein NEMAJ01_0976 [Nematocida major]KAH9386080.1 hypothetical protein NEMAJ01_0976 [Nematocida major]
MAKRVLIVTILKCAFKVLGSIYEQSSYTSTEYTHISHQKETIEPSQEISLSDLLCNETIESSEHLDNHSIISNFSDTLSSSEEKNKTAEPQSKTEEGNALTTEPLKRKRPTEETTQEDLLPKKKCLCKDSMLKEASENERTESCSSTNTPACTSNKMLSETEDAPLQKSALLVNASTNGVSGLYEISGIKIDKLLFQISGSEEEMQQMSSGKSGSTLSQEDTNNLLNSTHKKMQKMCHDSRKKYNCTFGLSPSSHFMFNIVLSKLSMVPQEEEAVGLKSPEKQPLEEDHEKAPTRMAQSAYIKELPSDFLNAYNKQALNSARVNHMGYPVSVHLGQPLAEVFKKEKRHHMMFNSVARPTSLWEALIRLFVRKTKGKKKKYMYGFVLKIAEAPHLLEKEVGARVCSLLPALIEYTQRSISSIYPSAQTNGQGQPHELDARPGAKPAIWARLSWLNECRKPICKKYIKKKGIFPILGLPEVLHDFINIDPRTLSETLAKMEASADAKRSQKTQIIECLYAKVNENIPLRFKARSSAKRWHRDFIKSEQKESKRFAQSMYKKAYAALADFYTHSPSHYMELGTKEPKKAKFLGKNIITNQPYVKHHITAKYMAGGLTSMVMHANEKLYNQWEVTPSEKHYHVHFVDNERQIYRKICMPLVKVNNRKVYLHTIEEVIQHISSTYELAAENIFPLIHTAKKKGWRLLRRSAFKASMEIIQKNKDVLVFYYIPEGAKCEYFSLCTFQSERDSQTPHEVAIPLFFSPLMESALNLSLYTKKNRRCFKKVNFNNMMRFYTLPIEYRRREDITLGIADMQSQEIYSCFHTKSSKIATNCLEMNMKVCLGEKRKNVPQEISVTWSTKVSSSERYSHYFFGEEDMRKNDGEELQVREIIAQISARHGKKDSIAGGFVHISSQKPIQTIIINSKECMHKMLLFQKDRLSPSSFVVVRNVGCERSDLKMHSHILQFLFCRR